MECPECGNPCVVDSSVPCYYCAICGLEYATNYEKISEETNIVLGYN